MIVNQDKELIVKDADKAYECYAIKTKLITQHDQIQEVINTYVEPIYQAEDILFISEKMIACIQKRAIRIDQIKPSFLAKLLSKFVTKTPRGIGLGMPETMQCALDECGVIRILVAAFVSGVSKIFGVSGLFYKVAGPKAASIDGPCHWTIEPYNNYVVLGPLRPDEVAKEISKQLNDLQVVIVDLNDFGGNILGKSNSLINEEHILALLKQNPLGQSKESTPMGILRPRKEKPDFSDY